MIGTGVYVPPARGRRDRDAQAQKRSPRTTGRQAGGARVIFGATRARVHTECPRQGLTERCHTTPNQQGRAACSPAFRADSAAGRGRALGAEKVTAGVQSGIAHGARAGTSLLSAFPQEICRLAAGWLSEGARARGRRRPAPPAGVAHRSSPVSRAPFHSLLCLLRSSCLVL